MNNAEKLDIDEFDLEELQRYQELNEAFLWPDTNYQLATQVVEPNPPKLQDTPSD